MTPLGQPGYLGFTGTLFLELTAQPLEVGQVFDRRVCHTIQKEAVEAQKRWFCMVLPRIIIVCGRNFQSGSLSSHTLARFALYAAAIDGELTIFALESESRLSHKSVS